MVGSSPWVRQVLSVVHVLSAFYVLGEIGFGDVRGRSQHVFEAGGAVAVAHQIFQQEGEHVVHRTGALRGLFEAPEYVADGLQGSVAANVVALLSLRIVIGFHMGRLARKTIA